MVIAELHVEIVRYLGDDPQPGIVECRFLDAVGVAHQFIEKTAVVSEELLSSACVYPRPAVIRCLVEDQFFGETGGKLMRINTERPWGIESTSGETRFTVLASQISALK